jgi:hypothetical protein
MRRGDTFTLRVSEDERQMIAALSAKLQRSGSDVVRLLVREAVRELDSTQHDRNQRREGVHCGQ